MTNMSSNDMRFTDLQPCHHDQKHSNFNYSVF